MRLSRPKRLESPIWHGDQKTTQDDNWRAFQWRCGLVDWFWQVGDESFRSRLDVMPRVWIPAFAGMTVGEGLEGSDWELLKTSCATRIAPCGALRITRTRPLLGRAAGRSLRFLEVPN